METRKNGRDTVLKKKGNTEKEAKHQKVTLSFFKKTVMKRGKKEEKKTCNVDSLVKYRPLDVPEIQLCILFYFFRLIL
jgi:hypothetical protein